MTGLVRTPRLDALLGRLRRRLSLQILLHGAGTVLFVTVAWLLFAFVADWFLHVPRGVRWVHLGVLILLPAYFVWRDGLEPWLARPDRAGLALLIERRVAGLHELLVSAVQLQQSERPAGAPRLIECVLEEAESAAESIELRGVLDERAPRNRFVFGAVGMGLAALLASSSPELSSIFFDRLLGGSAGWPQRTHLHVSIPLREGQAQIEETEDEIHVRVARGTDVPILVRADGEIPSDVALHFESGAELLLSAGTEGLFRTALASCQEDMAFRATGGDDRDGNPRVSIEVLQPPDVRGIAVRIAPPDYTGLAPRLERDRDVVVPEGSRLDVAMLPDPPEARGVVRILPDDRVLELSPATFPIPAESEADEQALEAAGLGFEWIADKAIRFRFELSDERGLENPDPGLFAVHVVEDKKPELRMLSPGRTDFETTSQGLIALRVRAWDDYGIESMTWNARPASTEAGSEVRGDLPMEALPTDSEGGRAWISIARIEALELAGGSTEVLEGQQFLLEVHANDNRPRAGTETGLDPVGVGRTSPARIRIVSGDELLRRVQDRLARLRTLAASLEELQRQKATRTRELLSSLESDGSLERVDSTELAVSLSGVRRVLGDARAISREMAAIVETVLYGRIDEKAEGLLEHLDRGLQPITDRSFHPAPWRQLASDYAAGRLGTPAFAGQLVGILDLCLTISEDDAQNAGAALDRAALAVDIPDVHSALVEALARQNDGLTHIEELLERLAEWDNFQSILTLTRDILNRQRSLLERTRQFARDR